MVWEGPQIATVWTDAHDDLGLGMSLWLLRVGHVSMTTT